VSQAIGPRLKDHRQGRGLSQEAMAKRLAIDPGTLARWERGSREPRGLDLTRVEAGLAGRGFARVPGATIAAPASALTLGPMVQFPPPDPCW
jgi:transcriptional regulator with XRE-family HTH domain